MDLYKVINDISQITLALDKSIKVILKSLDDQYQSLTKQIQDIENQNQNPLIQLTDTSADLNNSTLCQTPKNSARTYSKPAQSKPLVSDESKQLEQKKENLRKEQNMFIQQQEKYKEEYLQKLRNEQAKHQQIFSQLSKETLQFRVLKQKIINYKNSMSLQQLEKESKLEQKLLYFVDEDLHQIQKISFNYIDVLNLQHQVLQVCQGNIQLYKNTENQIQQYYNYIQMENQRQEQERQKEQQKRQEEMQKEKLKQEQMEIERLKQLELEQQKQQRLKEDVIKQQLEKQKQVEEELTKSQLIQDVNDESDNLSDTQEITSECKNCGQAIRENNIQLNCFHSYHLLCLIQRIMSHQTSCIKCFCNEVIPFKIIKEVLSTSPQNAKYYEEFLKINIPILVVRNVDLCIYHQKIQQLINVRNAVLFDIMNKLKNNVTRSIPNLHASEIKSDYGKILNSLKPNELLEIKSTKNVDLSLKNKINSSIRENISSLSSDRQQPVKIKKIDIKVATIVELIKQDLLPMLNIQNQRIEKLEKKLKVKQDFEQELEQKESSLEIAKRVNSAMEKDFSNLSVSVDEVKKNLTSLDNFVKYQFLKTKHKHEEDSNIKTLQSKITTELNEQNQQTFTQIQDYMAIQLHEIKDWINKSQNDYKSQIEVKLEQMQIQFYEFMYQPIESIKQLQNQQIQTLKSVNNCFCNQTKQELCFTLNCGHAYHQDCLMNDLYDDKKECRVCQKKIKLGDLRNNCLEKEFIDWVYKQQLKQLLQENQLRMQSCLKCGFYWVSENGKQVDDCSQCKES